MLSRCSRIRWQSCWHNSITYCILVFMTYRATIGLEVHAELKTQTKMFCSCKNDPDEASPNVNVCPICLAHPGTLPVINKQAVEHVLRVGSAIGSKLADFTEFDRKSYFYPDIPKGYQISQYEFPLVAGGKLADIDVTRVHLEEDTARSTHAKDKSLIDFNRAGVPLMELVTEPVIHDAETAGHFARELQLLLRTLGASDANLEKGEMRIEANISVSKDDNLGTKVEVKNLNSFRSVERAIAYELKRQEDLIERGESVVQATRGWNESTQETFHQRFKEGSADYRYFPDPDLPKLLLSDLPEWSKKNLMSSLPELPWERRERYMKAYGTSEEVSAYISATRARSDFFDNVANALDNKPTLVKLATNYITSDLAGIVVTGEQEAFDTISPEAFSVLIRMTENGDLSSRGAKDVLTLMVENGGDPQVLAKEHGLLQEHDESALGECVAKVISEEPTAVEEYKKGKEAILQYLIGKCMKASNGAGNPKSFAKLLKDALTK